MEARKSQQLSRPLDTCLKELQQAPNLDKLGVVGNGSEKRNKNMTDEEPSTRQTLQRLLCGERPREDEAADE